MEKFNRQQDVMSYLIKEFSKKSDTTDKTRTFTLYNSQNFFGYGIAFHTEEIQTSKPHHKLVYPLIEVESSSPAEEAGMKNDQRVIAVNGECVNLDLISLVDVVQSIEDSYYSRDNTEITVIDSEFWDSLMANPQLSKPPSETKIGQLITTKIQPKKNYENDVESQLLTETSYKRHQEIMKQFLQAFETNKDISKITRTYNVYRSEYFQDLGINIQEQETILKRPSDLLVYPTIKIDDRSPAAKAGMQNNQRIVAVDGKYLNKELGTLHDVYETLNESYLSKDCIEIIVISSQLWESFIENPKILAAMSNRDLSIQKGSPQITGPIIKASSSELQDANNTLYDRSIIKQIAPGPRLCNVRAYEENLGFTVAGSKSNKGVYKVNDIAPNSPAAHSGLKGDDHIIEVSGLPVDSMSYQELVEFIKAKKQEDDLQLLVADRSTLNWYKSRNLLISEPEEIYL